MAHHQSQQIAEKILGRSIQTTEGFSDAILKQTEERLGISLPAPLWDLLAGVGKIPLFMDAFNHFASPDQLYVLDNKLVFLEENQAVVIWSVDLKDGKVYQTVDTNNPKEALWYEENLPLDKFIEFTLYFQCIMGDEHVVNNTLGGFPHLVSLSDYSYRNNKKAKAWVDDLPKKWAFISSTGGAKIYWQEGSIALHFFEEEEDPDDILFVATQSEALANKMMEEYDFGGY